LPSGTNPAPPATRRARHWRPDGWACYVARVPTLPPRKIPPHRIVLRRRAWDRLCAKYEIRTNTEFADLFEELDQATVWRHRTGVREPSATFIRSALLAFPSATFEELFDIIPVADMQPAQIKGDK
jgi:hypothetical protein